MISLRQRTAGLKAILNPTRSITYLHSGTRVRGLKRDPASFLVSPKGVKYDELNRTEFNEKIDKILNLSKYDIKVPNDLLLQCFTHKSFAHGIKPYNEKLSLLGLQFLKLQAGIYSISQSVNLSPVQAGKIQKQIDNLNFTNLGTQFSKLIISKYSTSKFIIEKNLDSLIFWKMRDPFKAKNYNGDHTINSTVLAALIGGILKTNGPAKTANFITGELLNNDNTASLLKFANEKQSIDQNKIE
ncbi:hypothetical protein Kpol_1027p2 [Vanderwaltozyma polyspora DSM 70294]|uniref:RNase III domain-containing protein n=1 Tax=Vanderwaltozyma polyspora (strain ATCC 22028 / DSM 70294 / BCRC 21397 / CBS 2163 / NBRC 10782 / NRRL Y-8283 / UCD 57-17) TaxID=436907 RepID=A7TQK7_VANPO|nr:uncharacterized protein Kpol_1027p2 [Vanderwaltozyma polyspora DSM 70294]EDO15428.1 hypothetical protein Kpol_1027p2 [Vanderwaltozyma polyspora DSM 70294]